MEHWNVHITTYPDGSRVKYQVHFFRPGQKPLDIRRSHKKITGSVVVPNSVDPNRWLRSFLRQLDNDL